MIVHEILERLPESRVLLLGLLPRRKWPAAMVKLAEVNERLARLADGERLVYLDIGEAFLRGSVEPAEELMPDTVHLSPRAYEIWAEAMEPTLQRMLDGAMAEATSEAPATNARWERIPQGQY
jgi:beta-glucosidase